MATAKKTSTANKPIKVTQIYSSRATKPGMQATLTGLGLRGPNKTVQLQDTPQIRGMIFKVKHLIKVEE